MWQPLWLSFHALTVGLGFIGFGLRFKLRLGLGSGSGSRTLALTLTPYSQLLLDLLPRCAAHVQQRTLEALSLSRILSRTLTRTLTLSATRTRARTRRCARGSLPPLSLTWTTCACGVRGLA